MQFPTSIRPRRKIGPWLRRAVGAVFGVAVILMSGAASAQAVCERLRAELASMDRGGGASQQRVRELQRAGRDQEMQLDRAISDLRRNGCMGGFYGAPPYQVCEEIEYQIQRMEQNLARIDSDLDRAMRGGGGVDPRRRRQVEMELDAYGCNDPRQQNRQREAGGEQRGDGLFAFLFGAPRMIDPPREDRPREAPEQEQRGAIPTGGTFRTLCVRERDGYYWPISYATSSNRFQTDAEACRRMCPGQNVELYVHRNPGEWSDDMVSLQGRPYGDMENAFRHRREYVADAKCERPAFDAIETASLDQEAPVTPVPAVAGPADDIRNMVRLTRLPVPRPDPDTPAEEVDTRLIVEEQAGAEPVDGIRHIRTGEGEKVESESGRNVRIVGPTFYPVR